MRQDLARGRGKQKLGELSIWQRVPTTYFQPVGLLADDLDCNAALLPSIFVSLSLSLRSVPTDQEITVRALSLAVRQSC